MISAPSRGARDPQCFVQQLAALDDAMPQAADDVRDLLLKIREAAVRVHETLAALHEPVIASTPGIRPVCFQCGRTNLEVLYTSKREGYQLCEHCFREWQQQGRAREIGSDSEHSHQPRGADW